MVDSFDIISHIIKTVEILNSILGILKYVAQLIEHTLILTYFTYKNCYYKQMEGYPWVKCGKTSGNLTYNITSICLNQQEKKRRSLDSLHLGPTYCFRYWFKVYRWCLHCLTLWETELENYHWHASQCNVHKGNRRK